MHEDPETRARFVSLWAASTRGCGGLARLYVEAPAADDVVQDAWTAVNWGIDRFEGCSSPKTWVFRIRVNPTRRSYAMSLTAPVLTGPQSGRSVTYGNGSSAELKIAGEQSGGDWAVVEWRVRSGDEPPLHHHTREDETVYVLEGAITAFVGDQRIDVGPGSYAALPKDIPHTVLVRGKEARLLVTEEPAGPEYFLVPRDESDADPAKFGIVIDGAPKVA